MNSRLATLGLLVLLAVSAVVAAPGTLPVAYTDEFLGWEKQVLGLRYSTVHGGLGGYPELIVDTYTIQHGRLCDTFALAQTVWYPFLFQSDSTKSFGVKGYKKFGGGWTLTALDLPDATPFMCPGPVRAFVLTRPASDTASSLELTVIGLAFPPEP